MTASPVAPDCATPTAVIDRIDLVLKAFDGPGPLSLAQVVRRTGLPRSSAHRILDRLVRLRWVRRDGRDYALGMRLVELGSLAVHQDRLHRAARPLLHDLHRATGLVVHLAVLEGADVVYLDKIGLGMAEAIPSRVGQRQPAHCTAVGKAILAHVEALPRLNLSSQRTKQSITTPDQLRNELSAVRTRGVAFDREECVPGFSCVAAPIRRSGHAMAALSVCGPTERVAFDQRLATPIRMTAMAIWRSLEADSARSATALPHMRPHRAVGA